MNSFYIVEILQLKSLFSDFGILRGYYVLWVEKILEERREEKREEVLEKNQVLIVKMEYSRMLVSE